MEYTTTVAKSVAAVKAVGADASVQEKVLKEITTELSKLDAAVVKLEAATDASVKIEDPKAQAIAYRDDVVAQFAEVREPADKLETLAIYICRGSISRIEDGSRTVTDIELYGLSQVLATPIEDFFK